MIMSKDEYLITDEPLKALTIFAMPMILGSFFQQVYNMADSIIVGQFVGSSALAAVGACAALTNVFICVALGAGVGAGVSAGGVDGLAGGGGSAAGRACVAGGQCAGGNAAHSGSGGNLQEAFTRDLFHLECSLLFLLSTFSGRKSFFREIV